MLCVARRLLEKQGRKLLNPGSSLLNPRSGRARLRQAMATSEAGQQLFDQQALFADVGGSGSGVGRKARARHGGAHKSKAERKTHHVLRVGADVAARAKAMPDSEWESVSMEDKHAFTRYMAKLLKERPTEATEQQRRRYFEQTMADPRDLDPNQTVVDEYERLKLGLPVQLKNPQWSLGVSQPLYEAAEASLFDPSNVHKLENAMTQVKQVFTDFVAKRRQGTSTEQERRRLANLTAELNVETQKHLANMFKYTEEKIRRVALEERESQLRELERLKALLAEKQTAEEGSGEDGEVRRQRRRRRRLSVAERKAKLTASISRAIGLDVNVVQSLLEELDAQERFMQFCEVFARLTVGSGFVHSSADEGLDAYTESLKKLYSVDASKLSTLDAVQYMAAKEDAHPVEWARRWYERALLIPLQQTPEYQRLHRIQEADRAALALQHTLQGGKGEATPPESLPPEEGGDVADREAGAAVDAGTAAALHVSASAADAKQHRVVRLVEKMFLRPDDPRLETLHEKRLRYLAYLQMERQIAQARENARLFAGVENSPEAAECRELYERLTARKRDAVAATTTTASAELHTNSESKDEEEPGGGGDSGGVQTTAPPNVFASDPEATSIFDRIRDLTNAVIARTVADTGATGHVAGAQTTRAARRARKIAALLRSVRHSGNGGGADAHELQQLLAEKKQQVTRRLLGVVERDVRAEVEWMEAMEEAERPPLLPVPEGMSYVSASEVAVWQTLRDEDSEKAANPFTRRQRVFQPALLGQTWHIPDKPMLFWGTGTRAVQQALQHAAEDASRKRRGEPLVPPYPCPENPWGWRLVKDVLDD